MLCQVSTLQNLLLACESNFDFLDDDDEISYFTVRWKTRKLV